MPWPLPPPMRRHAISPATACLIRHAAYFAVATLSAIFAMPHFDAAAADTLPHYSAIAATPIRRFSRCILAPFSFAAPTLLRYFRFLSRFRYCHHTTAAMLIRR